MVGQPVVTWVNGASEGGRRWSREKASWSESEAEVGLMRALRGLNLTLISGNLLGGIRVSAAFKTTNRNW